MGCCQQRVRAPGGGGPILPGRQENQIFLFLQLVGFWLATAVFVTRLYVAAALEPTVPEAFIELTR